MNLNDLKPALVWRYFGQITEIPRASGSEEAIIEWLRNFAEDNNLSWRMDEIGNIVLSVDAVKGCESMPCVTLQAHVDMVCEKRGVSRHNFATDAIDTYIDGGWVKARDTTLGADCGIGVAAALAALTDKELIHGKLEALFTIDEERGLTGAFGLGDGMIGGDYLVNLDSESEGEIFIGCAGGIDTTAQYRYKSEKLSDGHKLFELTVGGLQGGHSGDDINKGRGNAVKILSRVLFEGSLIHGIRLVSMKCGNLRNAIPREGRAVIAVDAANAHSFEALFEGFKSTIQEECSLYDKDVELGLTPIEECGCEAMDQAVQFKLLGTLVSLPNGVMSMSDAIEGLVESSTNLASVDVADGVVDVVTSQRSSSVDKRDRVMKLVESSFASGGGVVTHSDGYPGWEPRTDSQLLVAAKNCYKELYGIEPKVRAIHAGLECGLFLESYPQLDMISFGPTMEGVHSPDERLEIASVEKFYTFLCRLLSSIK